MAESSHILVVESGDCKFARIADNKLILDYTIGDLIKRPIAARLITVDGLKKSILVYTDFTEPQTVNGDLERYLGISTSTYMPIVNTYIPITGRQLPPFGYISLKFANGSSKFSQIHKVTVIIEILGDNGA